MTPIREGVSDGDVPTQSLFNPRSGRALDVAVDHGFFGEPSFLTGIEDMREVVETLVRANPDAVQLTLGQARHLQSIPGKDKPALVLRTDVANVYGNPLDPTSSVTTSRTPSRRRCGSTRLPSV